MEKAVEKIKVARQSKEDNTNRLSKEIEDTKQLHKEMNYPQSYNLNSNKIGKPPIQPKTLLKHKLSAKNIVKDEQNIPKIPQQESKTANLFDNIHNLL